MGFRERWLWRFKRLLPRLLLNRVGRRVRGQLASFASDEKARDAEHPDLRSPNV
jgi:hypothetical protein